MVQRYEVALRKPEDHKSYSWLLEQERLFSNVEALKSTLEVMSEKRHELNKLINEIQCNLEDTQSIMVQLNHIAIGLGLSLYSDEK